MPWADRPLAERAALRYCAPRGIPLSVFLRGRVVYPGEPQWLEDDVQAAIDWLVEQDRACPGCGQPSDESMAHEDDAPAYRATVRRCHACAVIDAEYRAELGTAERRGHYASVEKVG